MTYQIVSERKLRKIFKIKHSDNVFNLIKPYAKAKQEQFILVTLNGAHNVISISIISIGIVNKTIVHQREVFCKAITDRASAIIICHNHPSGALIPSEEDKQITIDIFKAGEIIGIPLIDHIIFSKEGYISLKQKGMFPEKE